MVKVIAFKAKGKDNRYLADGIDCVDWSDDEGDVEGLDEALLVIRKDQTEPGQSDLEEFYELMGRMSQSNNVQFIKDNYEPVTVEITDEQLAVTRERNEW